MHLREARVDLAGQIVPVGHISCTDSSLDAFALRQHNCITILFRDGHESVVLTPVLAERDPASGFLISTKVGPHIGIPATIAAAILATLQSSSAVGSRLQVPGQSGRIWSFEGSYKQQALSDWSLEVEILNGSIDFRLSASLCPLDDASTQRDRKSSRIDISFTVDSITRTALFEVPLAVLEEGKDLPYPPRAEPEPNSVRLESASIDQHGALHACSRTGFVRLTTRIENWFILEPSHSQRLANGFFSHPTYGAYYPRIRLNGINLPSLMATLEEGTPFVSHSEGSIGLVENELRNEIPSQDVQKSSISARIDAGGLTIEYRLRLTVPERGLPGVVEDRCTISWASLILRFPHRLLLAQRRHLEAAKPKSWRSKLWPRTV